MAGLADLREIADRARLDAGAARAASVRAGETLDVVRERLDQLEASVRTLVELEQRRDAREQAEVSARLESGRWWRSLVSRDVLVPLAAGALSLLASQVPGLHACVAALPPPAEVAGVPAAP